MFTELESQMGPKRRFGVVFPDTKAEHRTKQERLILCFTEARAGTGLCLERHEYLEDTCLRLVF